MDVLNVFIVAAIGLRMTIGCPNVQTMRNFDIQKFAGKWFEIQKNPNLWESGQKCNTAVYEPNPDGTITVTDRAVIRFINYPLTTTGVATPSASDPAKWSVKYSSLLMNRKFWILDTDYSNYALIYSCYSMPFLPIENAWIMGRTTKLDTLTIHGLKSRLDAANSGITWYFVTDHKNCSQENF